MQVGYRVRSKDIDTGRIQGSEQGYRYRWSIEFGARIYIIQVEYRVRSKDIDYRYR